MVHKKINEEYLANMEDILSLYSEPINEQAPRLCFDERPCLLVSNVVESMPTPTPLVGITQARGYQ
jgi:hypothetical protein